MAKFQKKPPVFDALQFTGGQANAKTIIDGVAVLAPTLSVRYLPASSEFSVEAGAIKETKFSERLRIFDTIGTEFVCSVGDWVLIDREGVLDVLTNADFGAQYQAI